MKKILLFCFLCFIPFLSNAVDYRNRPSIFSTSTDWEALTGLRASLFDVTFIEDRTLIGSGLELYSLDQFPCFAQVENTRIWMGFRNASQGGRIQMVCLYTPKTLVFAWRNISRVTHQDVTTGILECPVIERNGITIDMSKCTKGKDWKDLR